MEDDLITKNMTIALSKSVLYICIAAVFGVWIYSCNLNASTIESCRSACKESGTSMESVTSGKCICSEVTKSDQWVIPRSSKK